MFFLHIAGGPQLDKRLIGGFCPIPVDGIAREQDFRLAIKIQGEK